MHDKLKHFLAGMAVATVAAVVWFIFARIGLVSMAGAWLGALLSASVAGAVKEKADADDNAIHPGMHGVEVLDALATAAGALPVVALLAVAA